MAVHVSVFVSAYHSDLIWAVNTLLSCFHLCSVWLQNTSYFYFFGVKCVSDSNTALFCLLHFLLSPCGSYLRVISSLWANHPVPLCVLWLCWAGPGWCGGCSRVQGVWGPSTSQDTAAGELVCGEKTETVWKMKNENVICTATLYQWSGGFLREISL